MTERQREIVLGYAECDMNAVETGRKLYLSCVAVGYHLNQIKKTTGIDPRSFYGLCKLVQMAKQIGGEGLWHGISTPVAATAVGPGWSRVSQSGASSVSDAPVGGYLRIRTPLKYREAIWLRRSTWASKRSPAFARCWGLRWENGLHTPG